MDVMLNKSGYKILIILLLLPTTVVTGCTGEPRENTNVSQENSAHAPLVAQRGMPAPDFELQDTSGKVWKLSGLRGQVVFVNFWATWCPPCREEMPSMLELHKAMPQDRFKMLTILSNDDPTLAINFLAKVGADFPVLLDPLAETGKAYGLTGVPETFIVDKKGVLRQKYLGPRHWSSVEAQKMIMSYINS